MERREAHQERSQKLQLRKKMNEPHLYKSAFIVARPKMATGFFQTQSKVSTGVKLKAPDYAAVCYYLRHVCNLPGKFSLENPLDLVLA